MVNVIPPVPRMFNSSPDILTEGVNLNEFEPEFKQKAAWQNEDETPLTTLVKSENEPEMDFLDVSS